MLVQNHMDLFVTEYEMYLNRKKEPITFPNTINTMLKETI